MNKDIKVLRNVFAKDPIVGGSPVQKPLPLKNSVITVVPLEDQKIKRTKTGGR